MKVLKQILIFAALSGAWCEMAQAKVSVFPSYVSFGVVDIKGFFNPSQSVTVYNQGDEDISLSFNHTCSFLAFNFQAYTCSHVPKGGSCTAYISFSPTYNGNYSCSMSVLDSTGDLKSVLINGYATGGQF